MEISPTMVSFGFILPSHHVRAAPEGTTAGIS
jgi:hypothetical protein